MSKIKCPKCKEKMDLQAEVCPHCKSTFSRDEVAKRVKDNNQAATIGCMVLLLIVGSCTWMVGGAGTSTSSVSDQPQKTAKEDAIAFYREVIDVIGPCDRSGASVANAAKSGDPVTLYQAAGAMESACLSTPSEIRRLEVPQSVGKKAYDELTKTVEICENAYVARWSAAGTMKKALDDAGSVSRMAELRDASEAISGGTLLCAAGLVSVPMSFGATQNDLD